MPFVETLESYSRALYLPLRGYVRQPFQFVTESIRDQLPDRLWDIRRAMEHTIRGSSRLIDPFNGFQLGYTSDSASIPITTASNVIAQGNVNNGIGTATGVSSGPGVKLLQSQPSIIHFFTSPYFLLLCFMVCCDDFIVSIVWE